MVKDVQNEKKANPFARFFGQKPKAPVRKIIYSDKLSKVDEERVLKLYDALVSSECAQPVDLDLIVTEGFPKFEETIGEKEFAKVKKHFGIGEKSAAKKPDVKINVLLEQLKTIENAQYYISGYKALVKAMADKLLEAPEELSVIERAKIVRMFYIVMNDREYFVEDYRPRPVMGSDKQQHSIYQYDFNVALSISKKPINPEEMFFLYERWVSRVGGVFYSGVLFEMEKIDRDLKKVLAFGELTYSKNGGFRNVNTTMTNATFGSIRTLKKNINNEFYAYPLALFHDILWINKMMDFGDLYAIFRALEDEHWMDKAKVVEQVAKTYSASIFVDTRVVFYEITPNLVVSGKKEADRIRYFMEFAIEKEFELLVKKVIIDEKGNKTEEVDDRVNVAAFMTAIEIAKKEGFIEYVTGLTSEFELAETIMEQEGAMEWLLKYKRKEISYEELISNLGINRKFAREILGLDIPEPVVEIVPDEVVEEEVVEPAEPEEPEVDEKPAEKEYNLVDTVINFAVENGYADSAADVNVTLVENVIIPGNEVSIAALAAGKIDEATFEKQIGFEDEFAEAYFNTSKINITEIESKLQDIKKYGKKDKIKKSKLVVVLYCYIVKNEIGCGPKNKPAKRNKGLKPEILMELIK